MVKADARLTYGDVKDVVFKIRNAGFRNVGLITRKEVVLGCGPGLG